MADYKPCGRPLYQRTAAAPPEQTCLMHHPGAPSDLFQNEVDALINGKSRYRRPGIVDFRGFCFPPGVSISGKVFDDYACFIGARFLGEVDFSFARFAKDANFAGAVFAIVKFNNATFEGAGVFAKATFTNNTDFDKTVFNGKASFQEARFEGAAHFFSVEFFGEASFRSVDFRSSVWFSGSKFAALADFNTAAFRDQIQFSGAIFEAANFTFTKYVGSASFYDVTFNKSASFDWADFGGSADFRKTSFQDRATFGSAKLSSAMFGSAQFLLGAKFERATFSGEADFQLANFSPGSRDGAVAIADFSGVRFEEPTRVWFAQVNKGAKSGLRARFINCDVESVHLEDVHWHRRLWGRMVLQDELDILRGGRRKKEKSVGAETGHSEYELVAIAYRKLVNNFDKVRALDLAEDCFCGAMEMKRRDHKELLIARAVLWAYKLASSYGSNYAQALSVLLGIVFAIGIVFAMPRLDLSVAQGNPGHVQMASTWFRRCPAGWFHSLQVATFQKDAVYAFTPRSGRLLMIAEQLLVPIQVALLLLALRRRFRR